MPPGDNAPHGSHSCGPVHSPKADIANGQVLGCYLPNTDLGGLESIRCGSCDQWLGAIFLWLGSSARLDGGSTT